MQCHRAVTLRMRKQFVAWRDKWAAQNVVSDAEKATTNWLLGKGDHLDFKPQMRTVRLVKNVEHKAPFGALVKYHVEYDKSWSPSIFSFCFWPNLLFLNFFFAYLKKNEENTIKKTFWGGCYTLCPIAKIRYFFLIFLFLPSPTLIACLIFFLTWTGHREIRQ